MSRGHFAAYVMLSALSVLGLALQVSSVTPSDGVAALGSQQASGLAQQGTHPSPTLHAPLPLALVPNHGQFEPSIAFAVQGGDVGVDFTATGARLTLSGPANAGSANGSTDVVTVDFAGGRPVTPVGLHQTGGVASYFSGPKPNWHTAIPMFDQIDYTDVWPGIDVLVSVSSPGKVEYTYVVHPGGSPASIGLVYGGASSVATAVDGSLRIRAGGRTIVDAAPIAYQVQGAQRVGVASSYQSRPSSLANPAFGFTVARYDTGRELMIDPAFYVSSGYVGGTGDDQSFRIAVDGDGNEYVTGLAGSDESTLPILVGPDLTYNGGRADAFVGKLSPDANGWVYLGYIGGAGSREVGLDVVVGSDGAAYVSGTTDSDETTFPVTVGPDLTYGGNSDMFVAKVSPDGTSLLYCGYVGGDKYEEGMRLVVDSTGEAYLGGFTGSDQTTLPVTVGPSLTYSGGIYDGMVGKIAPDGSSFIYLGYIGGAGDDRVRGITLDAGGDAYVTGLTSSDETTFPVTGGPDLTYNGGLDDAYVAEVDPTGTSLLFNGYIGGAGDDKGRWIELGSDGTMYVTGQTNSDETTFPVLKGPDLTYNGGHIDAFAAHVAANGLSLIYAGYIGGADADGGRALAVASSGSLFVVGQTESTNFPHTHGLQKRYGGNSDGFVVQISPSGGRFLFGTYLGGTGLDYATGVAMDANGNVYVTGTTESDATTFPVVGGPDTTYNGGEDGFVTEFGFTS